ncbi:MAG: hypothetical protein M3342_22780, partial [Bacteroidota bacterium]|nr:hypothetical protein [Bacteroidota bacterium]
MKIKIVSITTAVVAMVFMACNNTETSTTTVDSKDTVNTIDTSRTVTTTTTTTDNAYAPAEGDVTYRERKVMVWRNGQWVEADKDVRLNNGVVVY